MWYAVGAVARTLGLTPGALHYYEREGLITPLRSESGRRYYDDASLWRLLSYEKYHSMEYPIKTVIEQFMGDGHRAMIEARVRDRLNEARRKSAYYAQLAAAIETHVEAFNQIDELLTDSRVETKPPFYFWHADEGWISGDPKQQAIAARFIAAMPAVQIAFRRSESGKTVPGYAISESLAQIVGFEAPEQAVRMPERRYLRRVLLREHDFIYAPGTAFEPLLRECADKGLTPEGPSFGRVLLVEIDRANDFQAYLDLWVGLSD